MSQILDRLKLLEEAMGNKKQNIMVYTSGRPTPEHAESDLLIKLCYDPPAVELAKRNGREADL